MVDVLRVRTAKNVEAPFQQSHSNNVALMLTQRCFNVDAYDKLSAVNTFYLCNQFVLVPHLVKEGNHEAIHRLKPFDSTLVNWSRQKKVFLTIRT